MPTDSISPRAHASIDLTTTDRTWPAVRDDLQRLHAVTYTGPAGTFRQTTALTKTQRDLLAALDIEPPKKILNLVTHP